MRLGVLFGTAVACITAIAASGMGLSQAIQLQDGTVYFAQPPRLVETATTYNDIYVWGATYYFTLKLPDNAGEPLQRLTINQHEGVDNIRFDLKKTFAFEGTRSSRGKKLSVVQLTDNRDKRTISLTFDPPVSPGKSVTIGLKPVQNPTIQGVYLFGVTAFPLGEKSYGQFLGYGRLQFYSHSLDSFLFPRRW